MKKALSLIDLRKNNPFDKTNYRPISILPVLSKAFERWSKLYDQIYEYIDTILSKVHCGFRKGFSTQYSLTAITEIGEKIWLKANRALRYSLIWVKLLIALCTTFL